MTLTDEQIKKINRFCNTTAKIVTPTFESRNSIILDAHTSFDEYSKYNSKHKVKNKDKNNGDKDKYKK